ncbi:MAG: alpha/beta hydrolase-fold protein [Gillisia sp.]
MISKKQLLLFFILMLSLKNYAQNPAKVLAKEPFIIGETLKIHSDILKEDRLLNIYLPEGFSRDSVKPYPVIYLLDGSKDEDFIHISGLVQFGSFSWIKLMPKSIVVGIANIDRQRDFTFPTHNKKDKSAYPSTGGSAKFIDFLKFELQPLIEKTYKTSETKTLIGQSLGGLLAVEILFKEPNLFDNYLIVSPSLWWDDESLLTYTLSKSSAEKTVYIAVGNEEEVMQTDAGSYLRS